MPSTGADEAPQAGRLVQVLIPDRAEEGHDPLEDVGVEAVDEDEAGDVAGWRVAWTRPMTDPSECPTTTTVPARPRRQSADSSFDIPARSPADPPSLRPRPVRS
jgi:hypothetical protein